MSMARRPRLTIGPPIVALDRDGIRLPANKVAVFPTEAPSSSWSDQLLVRSCLAGAEDAWVALIGKYKSLIYAVPLRAGASPQDAADIFQAVCLELFAELPRLRRIESLRSWLLTVATHKVYHLWRQQRRSISSLDDETQSIDEPAVLAPPVVEEVERQQQVREAILRLPPRCRELVRLLFYEHPPRPYRDVARQLGLSVGSIGFIRSRCLVRLERILQRAGLS